MESIFKQKPIVSYFSSGNPCLNFDWTKKLTEVNVIRTKQLTDELCNICLLNVNKIYLHLIINGMGKSPLEPNIPSVKTTFLDLQKLIEKGFPANQILVIVDPILPNENGLKALQLLLRVFTEFKALRLRFVRFNVLYYRKIDDKKYVVANDNILKRPSTKNIMPYLNKLDYFFKEYYLLLRKYETIISIDKGEESLIGVRELIPFGYNNSWTNPDGSKDKIIHYENGNRFKPVVNIISNKNPVRCTNRCLLCYYRQ